VMTPERGGRTAIKWGWDRLREISEIDRLGVKDAVAIDEMVHGRGSVEQPIDGRAAFWSLRRRDHLAVGPNRWLEVRSRNVDLGGRPPRGGVPPPPPDAGPQAPRPRTR